MVAEKYAVPQSGSGKRETDTPEHPVLSLFRCAIVGRDETAWTTLVEGYHGMVVSWCRRAAGDSAEDLDELAMQAWERFWRNFGAHQLERAKTVASIFRYLKMCAACGAIDAARRRAAVVPLEPRALDRLSAPTSTMDHVVEAIDGATLWALVEQHLRDARERVLFLLQYRDGLHPAEVQMRRPDLFPTRAEVYRLNRLILSRLRRSQPLREWLSDRRRGN